MTAPRDSRSRIGVLDQMRAVLLEEQALTAAYLDRLEAARSALLSAPSLTGPTRSTRSSSYINWPVRPGVKRKDRR